MQKTVNSDPMLTQGHYIILVRSENYNWISASLKINEVSGLLAHDAVKRDPPALLASVAPSSDKQERLS